MFTCNLYVSSHIFTKDAFHSVLVMKPPPPLMEVLESNRRNRGVSEEHDQG